MITHTAYTCQVGKCQRPRRTNEPIHENCGFKYLNWQIDCILIVRSVVSLLVSFSWERMKAFSDVNKMNTMGRTKVSFDTELLALHKECAVTHYACCDIDGASVLLFCGLQPSLTPSTAHTCIRWFVGDRWVRKDAIIWSSITENIVQ